MASPDFTEHCNQFSTKPPPALPKAKAPASRLASLTKWQPQQGDITSFSFYFCAQNFPSYTVRMTAQNKMVWGIRAALARIGARSLFNPYMCVCGRKKWPTTACGRFPRMFRDCGHQPPVGWTLLQNQATLSLKQSCSWACSISHQRPNERVSRKINW